MPWRTSSYSTGGNHCVEVAPLPGGEVAVRDSKNRDAGMHVFSRAAWAEFTAAVKNDQLT
jgi:hypothetical protein